MIKVFLGFVVGVALLVAGAYVPGFSASANATSAHVLVSRIQAGATGAATQEFIVLYNNSNEEVDITGWCLTNKGSLKFACFQPPVLGQTLYIPAHAYATVASESLAKTQPDVQFSVVYTPLNQTSGSITGTSDTISLLNRSDGVIDRYSWSASVGSGMHLARIGSGDPKVYADTDTVMDWFASPALPIPDDGIEIDEAIIDVCPNVEDVQAILPIGIILNEIGECIQEPILSLEITEILPNPKGGDAGLEFIEIYNPNDETVLLAGYQLRIGPQLDTVYHFPTDSFIAAKSYTVFSNTDIPFSLLNTSSRVQLTLKNGVVVSDPPPYESPKENQSWANVAGEWVYLSNPTPGAENLVVQEKEEAPTAATVKPCAANQYRSLETNRCRAIAADTKVVTPCDEGSERNPETGRCRKVVAASVPTPCKEGQERNPETNRCRTVAKMPAADYGVLGAKTDGGGNWYVWFAVGGILLLALGYTIWEWHVEIGKFVRKYCASLLRFARINK